MGWMQPDFDPPSAAELVEFPPERIVVAFCSHCTHLSIADRGRCPQCGHVSLVVLPYELLPEGETA